ncbi:hypothetical protein ACQCTT_06525 [Acinetobacter geminorum]
MTYKQYLKITISIMTENFKLPFNISILELISLLGFLSIGYSLIYKLSFYTSLGIPWFINSLTPQLVFFSSVKFIFISFPAAMLGWYIGSLLRNVNQMFTMVVTLIFLGYLTYRTLFLSHDITHLFAYIVIFFHMVMLQAIFLNRKNTYKLSYNMIFLLPKILRIIYLFNKNFFSMNFEKIMVIFSFIACFVIVPLGLGPADAKKVLVYKHLLLNKVTINDKQEKWFVVDSTSEKVLIINDKNQFKIIQTNEIKVIDRPKIINLL